MDSPVATKQNTKQAPKHPGEFIVEFEMIKRQSLVTRLRTVDSSAYAAPHAGGARASVHQASRGQALRPKVPREMDGRDPPGHHRWLDGALAQLQTHGFRAPHPEAKNPKRLHGDRRLLEPKNRRLRRSQMVRLSSPDPNSLRCNLRPHAGRIEVSSASSTCSRPPSRPRLARASDSTSRPRASVELRPQPHRAGVCGAARGVCAGGGARS